MQTGTGHFSPIGGYHAGQDMALILDVARFKYPPHWVPLQLLWEAMNTTDDSTGLLRGCLLLPIFLSLTLDHFLLGQANIKITVPLYRTASIETVLSIIHTVYLNAISFICTSLCIQKIPVMFRLDTFRKFQFDQLVSSLS